MSEERWKAIPGFEGSYEVSDLGRVRSLARVVQQRNRWGGVMEKRFEGRSLKASADSYGYPRVTLWVAGEFFYRRVHTLVMLAFVGPCPAGQEVLHLDDVKTRCSLSNLQYGGRELNNEQKIRNGRQARGSRAGGAILTEEQVREIRARLGAQTYGEIGAAYGVCGSAIGEIARGKNWRHV